MTSAARLGDRSLFETLRPAAYLNHAAISPPSLAVRQAVRAVTEDYARDGVGAFMPWLEQRQRLRGKLAGLIGSQPSDIGFSANTTRGLTDIALCFPWRAGDRVLTFEGEFPANVTPWQRAAELFELELRLLPQPRADQDPAQLLSDLEAELQHPKVRLLAVSAVQFQTGLQMPLEAIGKLCEQAGVQLAVDAIQACGVAVVDVRKQHIDYLSCGSHKWLMGLDGLAFVYIDPARVEQLRPHVAGWLSHVDPLAFLFEGPGKLRYDRPIRKSADFIEGGMSNAVGAAALEASLDCILALGVEAIFDHVSGYLDLLERGLTQRGFSSLRAVEPSSRSGILSLLPPKGVDVISLFQAIDPLRISCSTPDGLLRFAPHWPNNLAEVPGVLEAIDEALSEL